MPIIEPSDDTVAQWTDYIRRKQQTVGGQLTPQSTTPVAGMDIAALGPVDAESGQPAGAMPDVANDVSTAAQSGVRGIGDILQYLTRMGYNATTNMNAATAQPTTDADELARRQVVTDESRQNYIKMLADTQGVKDLSKYYTPDPTKVGNLDTQFASLLGSAAPIVAAAPFGAPAAVATGAAEMGQSTRDTALQTGDDVQLADAKGQIGAAIGGATGLIPGAKLDPANGFARNLAIRAAIGGGVMAGQNAVSQAALNPEQPIDWGQTIKSGAMGTLLGGIMEAPDAVDAIRARNDPYIKVAQDFGFTGQRSDLAANGSVLSWARDQGFKGQNIDDLQQWVGQNNEAVNAKVSDIQQNAKPFAGEDFGTDVAEAHRDIFDTTQAGTDPTEAIGALKQLYDSARPMPTPESGVSMMSQVADDANTSGIPDDAFHRIVAGVQGRFNDMFANDPTRPGPETINELTKRGYLPKLTKDWIASNFSDATDQMLGDYEGAKVNLINRISAHYEEALPGAMEAMRQQPVDEGLSRTGLNAQSEADKDATYISALLKLYPYMKDAKAPDGSPLAPAMFQRDIEMSQATQGSQLASSGTAWAKYDAWKNAIIKLAETYNSQTRTGTYLPTKRMSDGTTLELPAITTSLEDMVAKRPTGGYQFDVTPTRRIGMAGSNSMLTDATQFVEDKFRPTDTEDEANPEVDISSTPSNVAADKFMQRTQRAPGDLGEPTVDPKTLETEADSAGMTPEEKQQYVESLGHQQPAMGMDLGATNKESYYDIALHLMNKVDKASNAELWQQYGGPTMFGKGAKSPGKFELFKQALLAKMESDMDSTGALSSAQTSFYNAWRKTADQKTGAVSTLPKDWEGKRAQFRHALRLYWGQHGADMKGMILKMLADKPKYQQMLTRETTGPNATQSQPAPTGWDKVGNETPGGNDKPTIPPSTYLTGFRTPLIDSLRLSRGFARKLGFDKGFAEDFAITVSKMVQQFEETAGFGKMEGVGSDIHGMNTASETLGGPVPTINLGAIAQREVQPITALVRMFQVAAHELTHNYSDHNVEYRSVMRQQRVDAYGKLTALFAELGQDANHDLLNNVIPQLLYPPAWRSLSQSDVRSQNTPQEAVSRFMEHVMLGAFTKDNPHQAMATQGAQRWSDAVQWLPDDVTAAMNFAIRDVTNLVGAVKDYYRQSLEREGDGDTGQSKILSYLDPMMKFAKDFLDTTPLQQAKAKMLGESMMSKLTVAGSADWEDPTLVRTALELDNQSLKNIATHGKIAYAEPIDPEVVKETQQEMFGTDKPTKVVMEHEKRLGTKVPPWSHYVSLFYQTMRRYEHSGVDSSVVWDVLKKVNDLEPSYFRLTRVMHDPFLTYDNKGRLVYDKQNPALQMLQSNDAASVRGRQAVNALALWANEHAIPVVTKDPTGAIVPNPDAMDIVKSKLAGLPPATQQGVLEGLGRLIEGYKSAADIGWHSQLDDVSTRLAGLLMTIDKGLNNDIAQQTGKQVTDASLQLQQANNALEDAKKSTPMLVQQSQQAQLIAQRNFQNAVVSLQPDDIGAVQKFLLGPDGLAQKLLDLQQFFAKREGWFTSETRPGNIFIVSRMKDGTKHYTSAPNAHAAQKLTNELTKQGHTGFQHIDRNDRSSQDLFQTPDSVVDDFVKLERTAWNNVMLQMREKLAPEDMQFLDSLNYTPGEASEKFLANKAVERYMKPRKLLPGREQLDAFEVFRDYTNRLSSSVARKALRRQVDLAMKDPRVKLDGEFRTTVHQAMEALMTPLDSKFVAARAGITANFLGLSVIKPFITSTHTVSSILPYLQSEAGFIEGTRAFKDALIAPAKYMNYENTLEGKRTIQRAKDKESADPRLMTKEESVALYDQRKKTEGGYKYGPIWSATLSRDHSLLTQAAFGLGKSTPKTREQLLIDPIYRASQYSMWLYSTMTAYNARVGFLGALDILYDKGYRGVDLYQRAGALGNMMTFGGGKANSVGFVSRLSNPNTRSWLALTETMQRYALGRTTQFKDFVADVIGTTELPPQQRANATKALATSVLVQFLLAGAMGITGMGIAAALVKSMTGYDPKQKLREFWVHLAHAFGADDEMAVQVANVAQNGLASEGLGVDLSSRFGNNSLLGFNSYDGWNTNELFGAAGGELTSLWDAGKFVAQGKFVKAGINALPPNLQPAAELASSRYKYGDYALRDDKGNMTMPLSGSEATQYALGLKPARYRMAADEHQAVQTSNDKFKQVQDQQMQELSQELLKGNSKAVWDYIHAVRAGNPLQMPQALAQQVINHAIDAKRPEDPLSSGPILNTQRQKEIASSFGDAAPRGSQLQDLIQRNLLNAKAGGIGGQFSTEKEVTHAAMVDALVKQKGMTAPEAERLVGLMGY